MSELNPSIPASRCATRSSSCTISSVRLAIAAGFVLFVFLLLAGRFFYLQVVRHGELHTLAEANRISIVPVVPNRGIIVDRNGVVLAHNYSAYTLEIQPGKVDEPGER